MTHAADTLNVWSAGFGLTRKAALAQMPGAPFLDVRRADLIRCFPRLATLSADIAALCAAGWVAALAMPQRLSNGETLHATRADFHSEVPATPDGAVSARIGFLRGGRWPRYLRRCWPGHCAAGLAAPGSCAPPYQNPSRVPPDPGPRALQDYPPRSARGTSPSVADDALIRSFVRARGRLHPPAPHFFFA